MLTLAGRALTVPILQGGMGVGVSLGGLAGAVAACGGMGCISTADTGYREPDFEKDPVSANRRALAAEIAKAKEIAGGAGIVAINAMVATQNYADAVKTAVEAGVDAIVSGAGLPLELPGLVGKADVALAPIVSSGRAAKLILRRWAKAFGRTADFVVIEGCKAGGHLGFAEEDLLAGKCQTLDEILPEVLAEVKPFEEQFGRAIPVFVAGGVYTGEDMAHYMKQGAAGVQIATRFIPTYECDASQAYKDVLLNASAEDVRIIHSPVGMPGRALNTPLVQKLSEGMRFPPKRCARCLKGCNPAQVPYCITHALIEAVKGNVEEGLFFCGANVGRLDKMRSVRALMDELMNEWRNHQ
ncbi:MAG: nitronate monooxygenase [Ruminococcaceae bacterium]|nr:nitronate monooxygenase [Oscillospiraceae bacterium]